MNYNDALKHMAEQLTPFQIDLLHQITYWNNRGQNYNFYKNHLYSQYEGNETPKEIDIQIKWLIDNFLIKKECKKGKTTTGRYITKIVFTLTDDGKFCLNHVNCQDEFQPVYKAFVDENHDVTNVLKNRINFNLQQQRLNRLSKKYKIGKIDINEDDIKSNPPL